jgi:hypothetical protein
MSDPYCVVTSCRSRTLSSNRSIVYPVDDDTDECGVSVHWWNNIVLKYFPFVSLISQSPMCT